MNGFNRLAPIHIPSTRLYITSESLFLSASFFARTQGSVSSMYLLHRLNILKTSVRASAICISSIFFLTFSAAPVHTALRSSSYSPVAPVLLTNPSKYLLLMVIVRLTRFPKTFARSELYLSVISSQVIVPSLSYGIS